MDSPFTRHRCRPASRPRALFAACIAATTLLGSSGLAGADNFVVVPSPTIGGAAPPYGSGFDTGVVVAPRDGCRSVVSCAPGDFTNRPAHRRYYDNYFDVPTPTYSGQRRIGGTPAIGGATRLRGAQTHQGWCATRYRSYRSSDNTYQPFNGERTACLSPF